MIALRADLKVVLATQPVDFRKSVHTLSALVSEALHANPYCGDVFVFRSKRMQSLQCSGQVLRQEMALLRGQAVRSGFALCNSRRPGRRHGRWTRKQV